MDKIKKLLGFGCMRLPMNGENVDYDEFNKMIDTFIENGFNYFDTAHGYIGGKSEIALHDCLTSRYPRDAYMLTDKLSGWHFNSQEEIRPLFESQLKICGVDYFDFYLMHSQNKEHFEKYKKCKAYETALEFKKEGKIKHLGISFHDTADVLDEILTAYPQVEVVQLQFNYYDYEDENVQGRKCYEVCRKHNKPIIVMEPVRGGNLVALPEQAQKLFDELGSGSNASFAIRYAAGFEGVINVLSGMGNMEMMNDNISYMKDFKPLSEKELEAVQKVTEILRSRAGVPCTACNYCTEECPMGINIPELFACLNRKFSVEDWESKYNKCINDGSKKASECIKCGACEAVCPQHIEIRSMLETVVKELENA